jgi:hypothetical protein
MIQIPFEGPETTAPTPTKYLWTLSLLLLESFNHSGTSTNTSTIGSTTANTKTNINYSIADQGAANKRTVYSKIATPLRGQEHFLRSELYHLQKMLQRKLQLQLVCPLFHVLWG